MNTKVFQDDVIDWARKYDGPKFHALLTDPPYHLTSITERFGKADSAPAKHGKDGAFQRASAGFMGQQWDGGDVAFRPETWAALAEHLHPGAFGMAFSGSRTWHRMAVAIEDAGLIIHPTIYTWIYASGFPKATRVKDAPAFEGHRYGLQALKPAAEPIILFSKSEEQCYNDLRVSVLNVSSSLERLWNAINPVPKDVSEAAFEVNTQLLKRLEKQILASEGNGSTVGNVPKSSTYRPQSSRIRQENEEDIVPSSVIENTEQNLRKESANIVEKPFRVETQSASESIVVENVPMPPEGDPCWQTLSETGIDTNTVRDILLFNSEKEKFGLNTLWLWRLILEDVCDVANKSTIETAKKMTTDLIILNYSLLKLMPKSQDTPFKKSLSAEQWFAVADVTRSFIGLSTYPKKQGRPVQSVINPIIVFQKPYENRPVDDITATGAGALNVDGARIGTEPHVVHGKQAGNFQPGSGGAHKDYRQVQGRWPANLILSHHPECVPVGVAADEYAINRFKEGAKPFGGGEGKEYDSEAVEVKRTVWECHADCQVRRLDEQTDSDNKSRFFFNADFMLERLEDSALYHAKASVAEREAGLENLAKNERPGVLQMRQDGGLDGKKTAPRRNHHPTLKPLSLAKELATLLLPPDAYAPRRLLVPFAGTGSEMIGAGQAGWEDIVGIELGEEYAEIAEARIEHWVRKVGRQMELFE